MKLKSKLMLSLSILTSTVIPTIIIDNTSIISNKTSSNEIKIDKQMSSKVKNDIELKNEIFTTPIQFNQIKYPNSYYDRWGIDGGLFAPSVLIGEGLYKLWNADLQADGSKIATDNITQYGRDMIINNFDFPGKINFILDYDWRFEMESFTKNTFKDPTTKNEYRKYGLKLKLSEPLKDIEGEIFTGTIFSINFNFLYHEYKPFNAELFGIIFGSVVGGPIVLGLLGWGSYALYLKYASRKLK
ncbi:MAG: hypothetical protein ACRC4M_00795 [Mycoplasma sp.]